MKYNIKQSSLLMLFALFLVAFCFIACDVQDNEEQEWAGKLTPEALYQTSWRGTGHCGAWILKDRGIGIQFITEKPLFQGIQIPKKEKWFGKIMMNLILPTR